MCGCYQPSEGELSVSFNPDDSYRAEMAFHAPYCRKCVQSNVVIAVKMYQPDPAVILEDK